MPHPGRECGIREQSRLLRRSLADRATLELARASDVRSGMTRAVPMLRREGAAERVEWWSPTGDGGSARLEAADGDERGSRTVFPVGPAGTLVVAGDRWGPPLRRAVSHLAPILRRRWSDEQLIEQAVQLARRNVALEDFAALVAHELKASLHAALLQDDAPAGVHVQRTLDLIDSLLEAAQAESATTVTASAADCLDEALRDLGPHRPEVFAYLPCEFPLPSTVLRVVLRNLLANAAAAGAAHIHIGAGASSGSGTLVVDDDGVGLAGGGEYVVGSCLGLSLCRRLAGRYGGTLELTPRAVGGTRATLVVSGLPR
jgi:signal transduction histidine kinase